MLISEYKMRPPGEIEIFSAEDIPDDLAFILIKDGKKYRENDWKSLKASMYNEENREAYLKIYKERRIALASLSCAEFAEKSQQFFEDIVDGIWCICEESSWEIPNKADGLCDFENPSFNINSARTASLLALSCHLFRKALPVNVKKRVLFEVRRRALDLFADAKNITPEAVFHILTACVFLEPDEERRNKIVDKTLGILEVFLSGCEENSIKVKSEMNFYRWYAYVFDILEILSVATDKGSEIFSSAKAERVAKSIYKSYIGSDGFCERAKETDGARLYLFGKRTEFSPLADFGASEYIKMEDKILTNSYNIFHKLYSAIHKDEILAYGDNFTKEESGYIESMDLYIKKTKDFSVAVKGGEFFAGNLMVYLGNKPYVVDLEKSHNLPIVNGFSQFANTKNAVTTQIQNGISIDITDTYPQDAGVKKWIRTVIAEEDYIILSDEYELTKKEDLRIVLLMKNKPILSGDRILIGAGSIVWDGDLALRVELIRSKNYGYVYRLVFHIKGDELASRVRIGLRK